MAYSSSASRPLLSLLLAAVLTAASIATSASPASADPSYVVQPGDTLSVIAKRHGVSTRDLAAANSITNHHLIRVGQKLTVPGQGGGDYVVASGDTVSGIAKRFGVATRDLVALNGITDPHRIRVGQKLAIPSGGSPAGPTTASYPHLPTRITANPERLALVPSFERWGTHYGVPVDLLMAVAFQESGWQHSIVSYKGAIGVGQILPPTARWLAVDMIGIPELDPYNPDDNIRMSARFLRWLIGYHGSESLALAGYYQGPTSVKANGLYAQTEAYVAAVEGGRWRFRPN